MAPIPPAEDRPVAPSALLFALLFLLPSTALPQGHAPEPPYPPSPVIAGVTWDWTMRRTAAPGSDLWPVTWGADDLLYTAWGDGGGFGGTDQDGRAAMGFARIEGPPERFVGVNINGGKYPHIARPSPITARPGACWPWATDFTPG